MCRENLHLTYPHLQTQKQKHHIWRTTVEKEACVAVDSMMQGWNETGTLLLTYETKKPSSTATLWIRPNICSRIVQGTDCADHQLGLLFNNKYMCINNKKKLKN